MTGSGHDTDRAPRHRGLLPRRQQPGPPLRRGVLHRSPDHRHLLPALVPGARPPRRATSRSTPPQRARTPPASAPASAACPTRRPGSPEWDVAADVAGRAMRLIADGLVDREGVDGLARRVGYTPAPPRPPPDPGAGCGSAGAGPGASRPERAGAHRDHRPAADRRGLRGRLRQRPPVQRDAPRDLRVLAQRAARSSTGAAQRRRRHDAAARPHAVRRAADARLPRLPPRAGRRGRRTAAGTPARSTCPTAAAPSGWRPPRHSPRRRRDRVRHRRVPARGPARHARPSSERVRRLLDADCDPRAVDDHLAADPVLGALVRATPGCASPGRSTATRRRSARSSGSRSAWPAPARSPDGWWPSTDAPVESDVPGLTHLFPTPATLAGGRPDDLPMPRARGRALVGTGRRARRRRRRARPRAPTATTYDARCWSCPASGRGRRTTSRCGRSATPTCSCRPTSACATRSPASPRPGGGDGRQPERWRPWRSYALMHLWNTLMPDTPAPSRADEEN